MAGRPGRDPKRATVQALARAFSAALLSGDEIAAERTVRQAMDAGLKTADIDEELVSPALWRVGEMWATGELSIAEEHLATEITLRVLALQREAERVARGRGQSRLLLATPSGEQHVLALRMVATLLREAGYDTVMLGPDVPARELAGAARRHEADAVCLSITLPRGSGQVLAYIDTIRETWPQAGFLVGGRGLTLAGEIRAGVRVCTRITDAVDAVDAMLKRAQDN